MLGTYGVVTFGFMTLPRGPRLISRDMTVPSLKGSIGGLVTFVCKDDNGKYVNQGEGGGAHDLN